MEEFTVTTCPICSTTTEKKYGSGPYWICGNCSLWFQHPLPDKIWHGPHEGDPAAMADGEKRANEQIASWLFTDWLKSRKGSRTLDVGAAFPWLAHSLGNLGCDAHAIDGEPHPFDGMACKMEARDFDRFGAPPGARYDLITVVHTFEHLYTPVHALRDLRAAVADDGFIYLRMPDHGVPGFERDLAAGHYAIHPFYHCLDSLLQAMVELWKDAGRSFEVVFTSPVVPGQRDTILRPIRKRPTLGLAMIVKNEARDLPRCLDSIAPIVDAAAICDTGSTDGTRRIAQEKLAKVPHVDVDLYLGASEPETLADGTRNWVLWDFAKARNEALQRVEWFRPDWVTWMDGDDELLTPAAYLRGMHRADVDTYACKVESGGQAWLHQRLWKASTGVRFMGRCHEYPKIDGLRSELLPATVRHHLEPDASQENANVRNLRLLMREWDEAPSERGAFYIANTHKDGERHADAVEWYRKRLDYGHARFRDEWLFAWLYMCRSIRRTGNAELADAELAAAEIVAPDWCEFTMERADIAYADKRYIDAINHAAKCVDREPQPTPLWREPHLYRDAPCRLISWCYDHVGHYDRAALWSVLAWERIGKHDAEHEARMRKLKARVIADAVPRAPVEAPAIVTRRPERIALVRPGAIGDVLMTLNLVPALKQANPDSFLSYYTHPSIGGPDALLPYMLQAGVDVVLDVGTVDAWKGDRCIRLVGYPLADDYPNKPMRRHLLHYFGEEMDVPTGTGLGIARGLPALELPLPKRPSAAPVPTDPYCTIQMAAGWSKYKEWDSGKWYAVAAHLGGLGIPVLFVDQSITPKLRESVALIANARMHLGIDSFGNHLTNYFWRDGNKARRVPGVILWGSTQMESAGYPSNTNIGHRLPCGPCFRENPTISRMPRGLCIDPPGQTRHDEGVHACMASIAVDEVISAALKTWEGAT